MIGSNAFNYINVLDKAADVSWTRNQVIAGNIANVDTPDYKRKDVKFESILSEQLQGNSGASLDKKVASLDLSKLSGQIFTDMKDLDYRMDGNNVDIDTESSYMADNQIKYYALLNSMTQEFNRLKMALNKS